MAKSMVIMLWLSLISLFVLLQGVSSTSITIVNNCTYTIWPAISTSLGSPAPLPETTGFELQAHKSKSVDVEPTWSGRIWARTGCATNYSIWTCRTGDCHTGSIYCYALPYPPLTYVELNLKLISDFTDVYHVNVVAGFNTPVSIEPAFGPPGCGVASCGADINLSCPARLRVLGEGNKVVACMSPCQALKQDIFCCSGKYKGKGKCRPSKFSSLFKNACPHAISFVYDDDAYFHCDGWNDYIVTFCPKV